MHASRRPFACLRCRLSLGSKTKPPIARSRSFHASLRLSSSTPPPSAESTANNNNTIRATTAPKPSIDIKHIRQNPSLYEQTCLERNYTALASYPARIISLHQEWQARQKEGRALRERSNLLRRQIANPASVRDEEMDKEGQGPEQQQEKKPPVIITREQLLEEARTLKASLSTIEQDEARLQAEIQSLALALPNLTSDTTPRGHEPSILSYINDHPLESLEDGTGTGTGTGTSLKQQKAPLKASDRVWRSHVHIGAELGILDFAGAATTSGWGWYYLLNEGAQLEQALVAYALAVATRSGWSQVSPPSMVYSHIAAACGFQPRENGATQIYTVAQAAADRERGRPEYCLAGTAEVPIAGMKADSVLDDSEIPCRRVAVSRCYRAEAGARGADTKGLYRVHEFTKVELFAWTPPDHDFTTEVFEEMVDMQTEILGSLGLHCRILEMPSGDLGASASRKNDIEAWFPSRAKRDVASSSSASSTADQPPSSSTPESNNNAEEVEGWGEVTSASICTDYQTRRLATRGRDVSGKLFFPWTVNGTAMAVPRVLAAILENGWDEQERTVTIPEVLRPWMDGREKIRRRKA